MQKILLTRSAKENESLADLVGGLGFEPISCPMISYEKLPINFADFKDAKNIIITSKFAAKIISESYPYKVNCFIVGEESAEIIKENPNINIAHIGESAEELNAFMDPRVRHEDDDGVSLYLSGNIITFPFEFAERHIIYNVEYSANISPEILKSLQFGIKYIFLYSKNCAINLIKLLEQHNSLQYIKNSVVIAMSERVASVCELYVKEIIFPNLPKASEMIKLLMEYETRHSNQI